MGFVRFLLPNSPWFTLCEGSPLLGWELTTSPSTGPIRSAMHRLLSSNEKLVSVASLLRSKFWQSTVILIPSDCKAWVKLLVLIVPPSNSSKYFRMSFFFRVTKAVCFSASERSL